jgi:hypothetical protein
MNKSCIVINKLKNDLFNTEKIISGMCLPIIYNDTEYLISSHTLFKNISEKTIFLESLDGYDNINTTIVKSFPEINIDILEITELEYKSTFFSSKYNFNIIRNETDCIILFDYIKEINDEFNINKIKLNCKLIKYNFINFIQNCPPIPIYELDLISIDDLDYIDLIGCPFICNNEIIGMIQFYEGKLIAIPIYILYKLLELYYNKCELSNTFLNVFDKNIVKINNKNIINNHIYSDEMNILIPINTYIMLYSLKDKINIEQELCNKIKHMSIKLKPLSELSLIPYENNKIIRLNNLIIVQLTHDIYTYLTSQYTIKGYAAEIYNKKNIYYKNNNKKNHHFIVVKVLWDDTNDIFYKNGFPLIHNNDGYIIPILSKINNIKINNINNFYDIQKNDSDAYDCIFTLNDRFNKQKITLQNLNITID